MARRIDFKRRVNNDIVIQFEDKSGKVGIIDFINGQFKLDTIDMKRSKNLINERFNSELNFERSGTIFMKEFSQSAAIAFSSKGLRNEDAGNAIYAKIIADGSAITFGSEFLEARNDYNDSAGVFDCWFTLLPDLKIQYSIIERV